MKMINGNAMKRLKQAKKAKLVKGTAHTKYKGNLKGPHSTEEAQDIVNQGYGAVLDSLGASSKEVAAAKKAERKVKLKRGKGHTQYKLGNEKSRMKDYDVKGTNAKEAKKRMADRKTKPEPMEISKKPAHLPDWLDKHFGSSHASRVQKAGLIGAGVGIVAAAFNNEEDDVLSTGEKMVKYAALGVGASYGTELGANAMGITSKHLAKYEVDKAGKKVMTAAEELRWNKNMSRKAGVATAIGLIAFGAATLMDGVSGLEEQRKATVERNRQEQELVKKENAEKSRQAQLGYGYVDYGQIAIQQFEKRIGHYAMGNARFN